MKTTFELAWEDEYMPAYSKDAECFHNQWRFNTDLYKATFQFLTQGQQERLRTIFGGELFMGAEKTALNKLLVGTGVKMTKTELIWELRNAYDIEWTEHIEYMKNGAAQSAEVAAEYVCKMCGVNCKAGKDEICVECKNFIIHGAEQKDTVYSYCKEFASIWFETECAKAYDVPVNYEEAYNKLVKLFFRNSLTAENADKLRGIFYDELDSSVQKQTTMRDKLFNNLLKIDLP